MNKIKCPTRTILIALLLFALIPIVVYAVSRYFSKNDGQRSDIKRKIYVELGESEFFLESGELGPLNRCPLNRC